MAEDTSTPLFTGREDTATFLASFEILSKACEESHLASNSESFSLKEHEGIVYVVFPSFHEIESFIVNESKYGEGNIQTNNKVFSDCLKGNDDKPALVHQGALKLFLNIMEKTDFQAKLQIYTDAKQRKLKGIIFVGHSLGGAVATLATLWVLEKRQSSPFCITFGCPLVGDERLLEAVGRENWGGNFLHVISQHDIVPRMLLAPLESIAEPLTAILPYWNGEVADSSIQDACRTLLKNVLQYTHTVAYYGADSKGSDGIIKRSPYKPFGKYMFCSSGSAVCSDNSETILEMLLTMQSDETLSDNIVQDWFSEHIGYGSVFKDVIENSISRKRFANPDSKSSYQMGTSLQSEAIDVGALNAHAQLALRKAGETENTYNTNVDKLAIELSQKQITLAELEQYKEGCEDSGIGYYDAFKRRHKDIEAEMRRVKLAHFWDDIIEKWEDDKLPSDFESQNKWINAGNTYRRLVEPLDIAHYYRTDGNGNYILDGRPHRHKVLEKLKKKKEKTRSSRKQRPPTKRTSLTADSCFWAHVEEAWKDLENLKKGQQQSLQNLKKFEEYVTKMEDNLSVSSDVFLEGSRFMMWREDWKEYKKNSPLYKIMIVSESKSSSKFERIGGFTVCQETSTLLPSSGILSKASEESRLAINSESFSQSVGQEIATFLASSGILSKAWEESCLAINSESYSLNEYEGVAYVGFPSFHEIEGFIVKESKYGECNIQTDNKVFSGCLKGNDDQPAFVHQGALKLLLHIMENTDFQAKLQIYTDWKQKKLKPIIFVGHFLGGAVATLATLWVLQKRLRQSSPFCVTFGCPLVGDGRLVEAVGRENWAGNFCHVVSKNDIVPRMLLAPFEFIAEPLNALLPYWRGKISNARNDEPDSFIRDAYRVLLQSVRQLDTSPYRPFGTYMFCSSHGAACIANSETVLEMLQLTMQSQETSSDKIVQDCLLEHIRYGSVLEHVIQNSICGRRIANSNSESSYERGISLELEAIGIGAQNDRARIALQKAGDIENKHNTNVAKLGIELRQQRCTMAELEWYKECCEKEDLFYYDSFKIYNRKDNMDADANLLRVKMALFWDEIMEKLGRNELPSNFQSQIKWINAGTAYRRLVEPLDIAHYYRTNCNGNYLSDGRPTRHKVLQKWMEEKEETGSALIKLPSLSRDSCFFAHVEEALKDFENLQQGEYRRLESLEKFEDYVTRTINEGGISSDVIKRTHAGSDSIPSSLHHLSSNSPLEVLSIKVSSSNKS